MINIVHYPIISILLLLITAALMPLFEKKQLKAAKVFPLFVLFISFVLNVISLQYVNQKGTYSYNFGTWSEKIGIEFLINEFSLLLSLVFIGISFLLLLYAFSGLEFDVQENQIPGFYSLFFLSLYTMVGIALTNDLFNIYVFVEIGSIAACGIISAKRKKENYLAALRYLILSSIGSVAILFGVAFLYQTTGRLNITEIASVLQVAWQEYPLNIIAAMAFMLAGLTLKTAIFPVHIWLPDAHSQAPTVSSAALSGLVLKSYVIIVVKFFFAIVGQEIMVGLNMDKILLILAVLSMLGGSFLAMAQQDLKRMLAYSSVAQIGYIFLGLGMMNKAGFAAAMFHLVSHALLKSMIFLAAGTLIYQTGKRKISDYTGMAKKTPLPFLIIGVGALGMIGIPGVNGFMSKLYLMLAAMEAKQIGMIVALLISSFLNAVYYLPVLIKALTKKEEEKEETIRPIPTSMGAAMITLAIACFFFGLYPDVIMDVCHKAAALFFM